MRLLIRLAFAWGLLTLPGVALSCAYRLFAWAGARTAEFGEAG